MSSETAPHKCAACHEPAAKHCSGCNDTPLEAEAIYYCSAACQKSDWAAHKALCKRLQTRKAFYRAGETLQLIFYRYREALFDKLVARFEHKGADLLIHEGVYSLALNEHGVLFQPELGMLFPFPAHLLPSTHDKYAVLCHLACEDAAAWMHEVIKKMLKGRTTSTDFSQPSAAATGFTGATDTTPTGLASSIRELTVALRETPREVLAYSHDGHLVKQPGEARHVVLEATLKHGNECFVLDLSGAQFGHYAAVVPWDTYQRTRMQPHDICPLVKFRAFGGTREAYTRQGRQVASTHDLAMIKSSVAVNAEAAAVLVASVEGWEADEKLHLDEVMKLPRAAFERAQGLLVDHLGVVMLRWRDLRKSGPN